MFTFSSTQCTTIEAYFLLNHLKKAGTPIVFTSYKYQSNKFEDFQHGQGENKLFQNTNSYWSIYFCYPIIISFIKTVENIKYINVNMCLWGKRHPLINVCCDILCIHFKQY